MGFFVMRNIPSEYAGLIRRTEQALDYTYRIKSNYLKHEADRRKGDLESAKEFLESVIGDVKNIPVAVSAESAHIQNIRRAVDREYGEIEEELGFISHSDGIAKR